MKLTIQNRSQHLLRRMHQRLLASRRCESTSEFWRAVEANWPAKEPALRDYQTRLGRHFCRAQYVRQYPQFRNGIPAGARPFTFGPFTFARK